LQPFFFQTAAAKINGSSNLSLFDWIPSNISEVFQREIPQGVL